MIRRILKALILIFILADIVMLGVRFSPRCHVYLLAVFGRTPSCPLDQVVAGREKDLEHSDKIKRISSEVRLVKHEGDKLSLFKTRGGSYWIAGKEQLLSHLLAEQEANIYGSGADGVRPGDVVLDCGAHVGVFTRKALKAGARLVVAIEPAPENLLCLRRNLEAEIEAKRVIVVDEGVWNKEDFLTLFQSDNSAGDHFVSDPSQAPSGVKVHLTTIDKLSARLQLDRVDFIKMDIEGAERQAIAGARNTIQTYKPRLAIASYHLSNDPREISAAVASISPDYKKRCGLCRAALTEISPEILLFRHPQAL